MTNISDQETYYETTVTYTIEKEEKFYIIENVPARVCVETGERLFSPETVEKLQKIICGNKPPQRLIQTPVYEFSSI
jgi:YgiT-type zinc finger domain-containing protein